MIKSQGSVATHLRCGGYTGWAGGPKNETTLVRPNDATVQDKIKRISLKCSQRL